MTRVLVTGANSGLGSATVIELLRRGAHVVATVRSDGAEADLRDRLSAEADLPIDHLVVDRLDVTDADEAAAVVDRHRPDVVVNNAGAALLGAVADVGDDDARQQLDALVVGPVRLARLAVERGAGRVVQVSSMVADGVVPFTGWYAASKAALDAVSDVWRLELTARDVDVVVVECGAIDTGVWQHAGDEVAAGDDRSTAAARARWRTLVGVLEPRFADPSDVARTVADGALDPDPPARLRAGFASSLPMWSRFVPEPVRRYAATTLLGLRPH